MRFPLSFKYLPQSSDLSVVKTEESHLTIIISDLKWKTDIRVLITPCFYTCIDYTGESIPDIQRIRLTKTLE